jgi:hypothetical protein
MHLCLHRNPKPIEITPPSNHKQARGLRHNRALAFYTGTLFGAVAMLVALIIAAQVHG